MANGKAIISAHHLRLIGPSIIWSCPPSLICCNVSCPFSSSAALNFPTCQALFLFWISAYAILLPGTLFPLKHVLPDSSMNTHIHTYTHTNTIYLVNYGSFFGAVVLSKWEAGSIWSIDTFCVFPFMFLYFCISSGHLKTKIQLIDFSWKLGTLAPRGCRTPFV